MELVLILAVLAVLVWFFVFRQSSVVEEASSPAPYKVETPVVEKVAVNTVAVTEVVSQPAPEVKAEVKPEEKAKKPKKAPKSTAKAEVAAKRTRKSGKFVGDDKSTPDVNEAFKAGKSPKKPKMSVAK